MSMPTDETSSTIDVAASEDQRWMRIALGLAKHGQGRVEPNPMVGCVIVKDGQCIGQGYHQRFGGPHAEVEALRSLDSSAEAIGATAYVTLEPCCHHGKTPPCSLALIDAKVARVVVAMRDPFPKVDGGGIRQLESAGIQVDLNVLREDAESLNAPYLKWNRTGLPWVIAKWAMTADGRIATIQGESQWITGASSRDQVHQLRSRVDGILVGMGTVESDDPMLNARPTISVKASVASGVARIAKRIVLCRKRLPSVKSKLIQTASEYPTWIFASPLVDSRQLELLESENTKVIPLTERGSQAMVVEMLAKLGREGMTNLMIEGGGELLGSFLDTVTGNSASGNAEAALQSSCLIDEFHVFVGAKVFGGKTSPGPIGGNGIGAITQTPTLNLLSVDRFDDDVRMIYRRS